MRLKMIAVRFAVPNVCLSFLWLAGCTSTTVPAPAPAVSVAVTAMSQTVDAG